MVISVIAVNLLLHSMVTKELVIEVMLNADSIGWNR